MMATTQTVSPREYEVLLLIANEHSTQEIAEALFVSFDTALTHRKNLLRKLCVKNAAGLVRVAFELALLNPPERD
jgi:DNA-binding CsgD family transcriptional regulator